MPIKPQKNYKWLGIVAVIPAVAMSFIDQTVLPVALPTIGREFITSGPALQWCVNAYLLAATIFVLIGGKLGDRLGHKGIFLSGILIFTLFSVLCGLSPTVEFLVGSRFFQGVGFSLMFTTQSVLLSSMFPTNERGRATGILVSCSSLFMILGPLIGGYLTQNLSWRWIFWINIPIAAVAITLGYLFLPKTSPIKEKIDSLGFISFTFFTTAITVFFMQVQEWGWQSKWSLSVAAIAVISLVILIVRELRAAHPFLSLKLFKHPSFAAINITVSITQFILMINVFRTMYLQEILLFSPAYTGLIISMTALPIFFFSPIGGYLSDKVSPKLPIALGYLFLISSFLLLAFFSTPDLTKLVVALVTYAMGISLIFTPSYSFVVTVIHPSKLGVAYGMIATLRMLSGTMGLALIALFVDITHEKNFSLTHSNRLAEIFSFSATHFALAFLLIIAFAITFIFHNRKSAHHLPSSPSEGWD